MASSRTPSLFRSRRGASAAPALLLAVVALLAGASASSCRRARERAIASNAAVSPSDGRDVRCVERPEGCIWCEGRGPLPPLAESDALPPSICDPKDPGNCIDFCSRLAPECALPWRTGPSCLLPNENEFRRELFRRDTADRPEALLQGRVLDDVGRRVEGAKIRVWFQGTPILVESSGKDGTYHLKLRAGPWSYAIRISHPGFATELADFKPVERQPTTSRSFRLGPESTVRGRVTDGKGNPIGGVAVIALRSPDEPIESGASTSADDGTFTIAGLDAAKRYYLRASKFGWLPVTLKGAVTAPATRVTLKLVRTAVIKGSVLDADGEGQSNATVVALLSGGGGPSSPIIWTVDSNGEFAQDRFQLGTYYLWARHGEMLAYPPEKIELDEQHLDAELELKLSHRGARVRGKVATVGGTPVESDARAVLIGRSPLALPRKAVGEIDREGSFVASGLLPGRYEISVRLGSRSLLISRGPREVEVPIEAGSTVDLPEPVIVRPQPEE